MIFLYELKKILSHGAMWGFIALCIAFNLWNIPSRLAPKIDTSAPYYTNVFATYSTNRTAQAYITALNLTGTTATRMTAKYGALQQVVDNNAKLGYSYSPYFGEYTHTMHLLLFSSFGVIGILSFQGFLLAMLLALLAVGYEQMHNTEQSVYATKIGRSILYPKVFASTVAGISLYLLLVIMTLGAYFTIFDFSNLWSNSVSSGFNYTVDIFAGARPFTTWRSFTVASYGLASLGLSLVLVICFSLMGAIAGTLCKNSYIGFLMAIVANAILLMSTLVFSPSSYLHYVSSHLPLGLWLNSMLWFTDGGFVTHWKNFELWGAGLSLLALCAICMLSIINFKRKEIS